MTETLEIEVGQRAERGKNAARRLRVQGQVPATLYGLNKEPESLALSSKEMTRLLSHVEERNRVLTLRGGAEGTAMVADWQVEPVYGELLHVDLRRVAADVQVTARVALLVHGLPFGVKNEGGMEDVILRETLVQCLPGDVPSKIDIDVTELRSGQSVRLSDLDTGGKFTFVANPDTVVVRVIGKRGEKTTTAAPEA
ncbi:MAG: 50S ribosomal protein L25 [Acidobacteria bacterium]|nr:50S ribosomal protein L25 [Acidobacteriota bacterium]